MNDTLFFCDEAIENCTVALDQHGTGVAWPSLHAHPRDV